jgi:metal-dependent amidase/aminoacylase/carboxypeptidase family protein
VKVNNVIADTARLNGTIRDFDKEVFDTICKRVKEVVHGTCAAYGATATVDITVSAYGCFSSFSTSPKKKLVQEESLHLGLFSLARMFQNLQPNTCTHACARMATLW